MQSLQQGLRPLGFIDLGSKLPTAVKEVSITRNLRFGSSLLNSILLPTEEHRCVSGTCLSSTRPLVRTLNSRNRLIMAKARKPHGLGEILSDGYELTDHVVVDDDHAFDGNNEVIEKLTTGFKTFKEGVCKRNPELYDKLKVVQEPKMMMITCADSRVCPTMLHGLQAGEAFIVRNVANLVPPCAESGDHHHHGTSAAIEYAVTVLNVESIIVMGHSSCGGIKALMSRDDFTGDFIGSWVQIGMPAKKKTLSLMGDRPLSEQCSFCEQEAVNLSLANLLTFPFIRERLESGRLQIYDNYGMSLYKSRTSSYATRGSVPEAVTHRTTKVVGSQHLE